MIWSADLYVRFGREMREKRVTEAYDTQVGFIV